MFFCVIILRKERAVNSRFLLVFTIVTVWLFGALSAVAQQSAISQSQLSPAQQSNLDIRKNPQIQIRSRTENRGNLTEITRQEFTREDCATRLISALDRECHDPAFSPRGVYAKCADWTIAQLYSAMDKQLRQVMSSTAAISTIRTCSPYRSFALTRWLEMKTIVEEAAIKNSAECLLATDRLAAAQACYSVANVLSGDPSQFREMMQHTCGRFSDVAFRFISAGNLGISTSLYMTTNQISLQVSPTIRNNWRNAVEAVMVSYIYQARAACGDQDLSFIQLSNLPHDNRDQLLSAMQTSSIWSGQQQPLSTQVSVGNASTTATSGRVFNIQAPNLSIGRARLAAIIVDSIIGTEETRDDLDVAIITALGGRKNESNAGIYQIISSLDDGDTFVLRDGMGRCVTLRLSGWKLAEIDSRALCASGF